MRAIALFIIIIPTLIAQSVSNGRAKEFIDVLINNSDSLEAFVLPEELTISKRLGINYEGVKNKFLISYEIPVEIQRGIKDGIFHYSINNESIGDQFSILHFECSEKNYKTTYYFQNGYLISPPYFYYKDWQKIESEHFIFYVSEQNYFNEYAINQLENFVKNILAVLNFTHQEKEILKKEKLIYILCKNEDEIEKLTGYKARGMGNLAYDYVITTYNCHYHELLHILINYKLKNLPLFTHPFLQEGFAVAYGGRGGYEPGIILNLGKFLEQSDFLTVNALFNANEYKNYDASMSYPLSGLYNLFLINEIGIDNYFKFYLKYSSETIITNSIDSTFLPSEINWKYFVNKYSNNEEIMVNFSNDDYQTLIEDSLFVIKGNNEYYLFETKGNILISDGLDLDNYVSTTFSEFNPHSIYDGEKYLIHVNESEVAVYNLYTNNLIANYVSGFTLDMKPVPKENDIFKYCVRKNIFNEQIDDWTIKILEDK
jgi:hypothetical protein